MQSLWRRRIHKLGYAACFLNIMAGSVVGPMLVIWGTDNAAPDTMRVVVTEAIPGIGAMGSVMGSVPPAAL
ncbi:hypothetical protein DFP72DRAFT_928431 [Ephemerocybe angulata]|uniref:Uncharacterized protein n=1 Tax=Ephemerocybe angulata TaxID=980116 RepID=A0A8H6HDU6_9AGAR|nr:hypothetical protein DFP72DRAFT_928431 [Tulosesus angulatus]